MLAQLSVAKIPIAINRLDMALMIPRNLPATRRCGSLSKKPIKPEQVLHSRGQSRFNVRRIFAIVRRNGRLSPFIAKDKAMGILDGLMGNIEGVAEKLGLPADAAGSLMTSLQETLNGTGDRMQAVQDLAEKHGVSVDKIKEMMGGEDSWLGKAAGFLDKDGDGNPLNDLAGMAKGLFGGKE